MLSSCRSMYSSAPIEVKTQIKFYQPHVGKEKPFKGIIERLLRITKPAEGLNKPYMGDNVLSYKALPLLRRNIYHCPNVCESCGQFIRTYESSR